MNDMTYQGPPDDPRGTINTVWERKLAAARAMRHAKLSKRHQAPLVLRAGDTAPPDGPKTIDRLVEPERSDTPLGDTSPVPRRLNLSLAANQRDAARIAPVAVEAISEAERHRLDLAAAALDAQGRPRYRSDLVILIDYLRDLTRPHLERAVPFATVFVLGMMLGLALMYGGRDALTAQPGGAPELLASPTPQPRPDLSVNPQVLTASVAPVPQVTTRALSTVSPDIGFAALAPDPLMSPQVANAVPLPVLPASDMPPGPGARVAMARLGAAPDAALPASVAPSGAIFVFIGAPPSVSDAALQALRADFAAEGAPASIARVDFAVSASNLRFFHDADAEAALTLGALSGATVRDFTDFEPKPARGTIELYLAGN